MADVTLRCGRVVDSSSEEWRHECEARHLLDRMPLVRRREYLASIKEKRGDAAYLALCETITAIWQARRDRTGVTA